MLMSFEKIQTDNTLAPTSGHGPVPRISGASSELPIFGPLPDSLELEPQPKVDTSQKLYTFLSSIDKKLCFTFAVIGASRVGKSTFISKGFKRFQISKEPTTKLTSTHSGSQYPYQVRIAKSRFGDTPGMAMHADIMVLECCLENLDDYVWPDSLPTPNTAFVCYDASREDTIGHLTEMISDLHSKHIQTIVIACKCDLEIKINPRVILKQSTPAKLVEVESISKNGKNKMRHLVDWSIRQLVHSDASCFRSPEGLSLPPGSSNGLPGNSQPTTISPPLDSYQMEASNQSTFPSEFSDPIPSETPSFSFPSLQHDSYPHESQKAQRGNTSSFEVYQTLDALLDRLFYAAVSGNDPQYIDAFLLTYCRFATPKVLLTAFFRQLESLTSRPSLNDTQAYSFLRICNLLEQWLTCHPCDFTAPGVLGVYNDIVKLVTGYPSAAGYSVVFKRFERRIPLLDRGICTWDMLSEAVDRSSEVGGAESANKLSIGEASAYRTTSHSEPRCSHKQLKDAASRINLLSPVWVAEEITRMQLELFLHIEPRDWLYHVLVSLKSQGSEDNVTQFSTLHNHLGSWVTSLILCHESLRSRAKQMAKFIEVAKQLRQHHNYAGLRAVTVGILNATYDGDKSMELLDEFDKPLVKSLLSHQKLFASTKAHETYRLAFRNVVGPLIPETEIHTYDIARILEISPDVQLADASRIHWGKFSMTGKLIRELTQSQRRCRKSNKLYFNERKDIGDCIRKTVVMDPEMQHSRVPQPERNDQGAQSPPVGLRKLANILK